MPHASNLNSHSPVTDDIFFFFHSPCRNWCTNTPASYLCPPPPHLGPAAFVDQTGNGGLRGESGESSPGSPLPGLFRGKIWRLPAADAIATHTHTLHHQRRRRRRRRQEQEQRRRRWREALQRDNEGRCGRGEARSGLRLRHEVLLCSL